jgi:hypothetical protein
MIPALALAAALGVVNLDGQPFDPFAAHGGSTGEGTLVLAFVHPQCPVANRYVPELNRLYARYAARRVRMWVVYSGPVSLESARDHHARYVLRAPALVDSGFELADAAGVTMTPEAAVYHAGGSRAHTPGWRLVYRGRIDDRAPRVGVWRPAAGIRDVASVLDRLERGDQPAYRATQAVGCHLKPLS